MILSPNKKWCKIFFLSCPMHCDLGLIDVIVYYFQIWSKKNTTLLLVELFSSHIGPMYIKTPCAWRKLEHTKVETLWVLLYKHIITYDHNINLLFAIFCVWFFLLLSSSILLLVETCFSCCILRPSLGVLCLSGYKNGSPMETIFKVWL